MLADKLIIRDAKIDDVEELASLMNELGYSTSVSEMTARMKPVFVHPDYKTIVAVLNEKVVGMAGLYKGLFYENNGQYMRIAAFVVKQSRREQGIGKLLIGAAEAWAVTQAINTVVISSRNRDERRAAHAFYQKMGYAIKSSGFIKYL